MPSRDPAYEALLARLFAARRFGMRLELARIERCLAALGRPERAPRAIVHIGGTNGKGSTAAFVESMLRAGGERTGLFTSPHLSRFCERFRLGGEPAAESALVEAAVAVEATGRAEELTFFEKVTAMALWLFAEEQVEVAVLEVGLGGRFDATNAVCADVAVVTGVSLDHERHLGHTIEEIAREKAGIFKAGRRAVIGASGAEEAVPRLEAAARAAGVSELAVVGIEEELRAAAAPLGLPGDHQRQNAAAALLALDALAALDLAAVSKEAQREGLAAARLPGRMERLEGPPPVWVDGAHNPHAAEALARALAGVARKRLILILAISADKDARGIAGPLLPLADEVIVTRTRQERAMVPARLAAELRAAGAKDLHIAAGTAEALALASELAGEGDLVACAGSLFFAGEVREALLGIEPDPIPVTDPVDRPR